MNKYIKIILFLCGLILAIPVLWFFQKPERSSIFGPGMQDFSKNLTGDYKLYRNSAHEIFVAPQMDGIVILPSSLRRLLI